MYKASKNFFVGLELQDYEKNLCKHFDSSVRRFQLNKQTTSNQTKNIPVSPDRKWQDCF